MFNKIRGTYDIMPEEAAKWQYLEKTLKETAERYGFGEIRTPVIEEAGLFSRSIGEATDIVEKELYVFNDRKGRAIALRPEGTASVIRAYLESGAKPDVLAKFYYYGDMFRYDRPQKGRYREFRQFGVEAIGSPDPAVDAEVISMAMFMFVSMGLKNLTLYLNSIGCSECRRVYYDKLKNYINSPDLNSGNLCQTCQGRISRNPMRVFDCKEEGCRKVLEKAPFISDSLCPDCAKAFEGVKSYLSGLDVSFVLNPRLVRGLDYYTRTAFEIVCNDMDSPQQNALAAGGRYDNLISDLGGQPTPAVGWAMGIERVLLALEKTGSVVPSGGKKGFYIASLGEKAFAEAFKIADRLRKSGFTAQIPGSAKSLKSQMREADRLGAKYVMIIGDDELAKGILQLKDMETGSQSEVKLAGLEDSLRSLG